VTALKEKLQKKIEKTNGNITEAMEAVTKAEKQVQSLAGDKSKTMSSVEMVALADETDALVEEAKKSNSSAKEAVAALGAETEPELKSFLASEVKKLNHLLNPLDNKNTKCGAASAKFRAEAAKKSSVEVEKLRAKALTMVFHHQGVKNLMSEEIFAAFDKRSQGKVDESSFVGFFKTCEKKSEEGEEAKFSEEDAQRVFADLDAEELGSIPKDQFLSFIRRFMKVLKASVITEEVSMKSKSLRRLEEGEVLDVISGPTKDSDDAEITRLKVKAMKDDVEGWVTPVGNQGTIFMEDGGNKYKVVKETIMTGSFVIGEDTTTKDKKLKVGQVVEVRECAKKEETSGLMRMKVKVQADGQVGWVTSVGNTGITFLEVI